MVNPTCEKLGSTPSMIRELFAYGLRRSAEVGPEHVYDYSLGNPSIPAPQPVQQALLDVLHDTDPIQVHGYSMAGGPPGRGGGSDPPLRNDHPPGGAVLYLRRCRRPDLRHPGADRIAGQ